MRVLFEQDCDECEELHFEVCPIHGQFPHVKDTLVKEVSFVIYVLHKHKFSVNQSVCLFTHKQEIRFLVLRGYF